MSSQIDAILNGDGLESKGVDSTTNLDNVDNLLDEVKVVEKEDDSIIDAYINESISKIDLFSYYRAFFDSTGDWHKLTDKAKLSHSFMLMRAISAKHPEYLQEMNKNHNVHLLDSMHRAFGKPNGKPPRFMYIKTRGVNVDNRLKKIDAFVITEYLKINGIESKMFDFVYREYPERVVKELNELQKNYDNAFKRKTSRKSK